MMPPRRTSQLVSATSAVAEYTPVWRALSKPATPSALPALAAARAGSNPARKTPLLATSRALTCSGGGGVPSSAAGIAARTFDGSAATKPEKNNEEATTRMRVLPNMLHDLPLSADQSADQSPDQSPDLGGARAPGNSFGAHDGQAQPGLVAIGVAEVDPARVLAPAALGLGDEHGLAVIVDR